MSSFEFNLAGLRELMKSPAMSSKLDEAGNSVINIANSSCPGYMKDTHEAPFTAVCTVYVSDRESGLDNYLNNTLLKSVQSAGLKMR